MTVVTLNPTSYFSRRGKVEPTAVFDRRLRCFA
jgi:hypothetical protein